MSEEVQRYAGGPRPDALAQFQPPLTDHARELRYRFGAELRRTVASLPGGRLALDLGCGGRSHEGLLLSRYDRYLGADLPGNPVADITVGPDGRLPLDDASVDLVLSTQVIEHVRDVGLYLDEARRVLRPDGRLLLSTNGHYRYHPDPMDYWRWTPDGLRAQLASSGFEPGPMASILSGPSAALQLWQSTTVGALPRFLRPVYIVVVQGLIRLIESRRRFPLTNPNAVAYIVVATPGGPARRD